MKANKANLDYLCAIMVMGWKYSNGIDGYSDGQWYTGNESSPDTMRKDEDWNPSANMNDAITLLAKAANINGYKLGYELGAFQGNQKFYARIAGYAIASECDSLEIAACVVSLRAAGVKESQIREAIPTYHVCLQESGKLTDMLKD